jgi:hypothetical protein
LVSLRQSALSEKFSIELSSLSFQILYNYLSQNKLILIASIINDKIIFDKIKATGDRVPSAIVDSNLLVSLLGYSPGKCTLFRSQFRSV